MEAAFNNLDTYALVKQKFKSAWPNLAVEAHHSGQKLWKEGYDAFDDDALLSSDDKTQGEILFILNDDTTVDEATKLFLKHFGGEVFILSSIASIQKKETLAYSNNPFMLPINQFTYNEYRRRFTEQWPNLSISLFDKKNNNLELTGERMMDYPTNKAYSLHDYIFWVDWLSAISMIGLSATIYNAKLGIACDNGLRNKRIKELQLLEKSPVSTVYD